jgi:uncharacterized protein YciI
LPYAVMTTDKPNSLELRTRLRDEHLQYLDDNKHRLLAAGAMTSDDGSGGYGGVIIVDTEDRSEAEDFIAKDPFTLGGLFAGVTVVRWRKAFFNGERLV